MAYSSMFESVRTGSESVRGSGKSFFLPSVESKAKNGFEDGDKISKKIIVDPNSSFARQWNKIFLFSCLVALFLDPFFFFVPAMSRDNSCIKLQRELLVVITVLRTVTDAFHLFHMALQFRMAFVAPDSRVLGKGTLVIDSASIAIRYLRKDFWLDIVSVLPVPQVLIVA
jgi:cyclic nucleotide gated channel